MSETERESRPAGNQAASNLGETSTSIITRPKIIRRSPSVLEIRVVDEHTARFEIADATETAPAGTHVRLHVGTLHAPMWLPDALREDLVWQIVATSSRAIFEWETAMGGSR